MLTPIEKMELENELEAWAVAANSPGSKMRLVLVLKRILDLLPIDYSGDE